MGIAATPNPQRRRRNADTFADVQVRVPAEVTKVHGPAFGVAVQHLLEGESGKVIMAVQHWWETWRRAPQAEAFVSTDWERLTMMAPLVASYFAKPHYTKMAEIRQSESLLGATHVDRLKARIQVEKAAPETVVAPGVTAIDAYRSQIAG